MTKYGDISPRVATRASKRLLKVMQPLTVTQRFAQYDDQPQNAGKTIKLRRYEPLPVTTAPLAEGVTPEGRTPTYTDYTLILQQFGDFVELTDVIHDTHEDPVLKTMSQRLGEQAAQVIEQVTIDTLKSGVNVVYSGTATTRGTVEAVISRGSLRKVVRTLDRGNAARITSIVSASPSTETKPVEASFFAMAHTDLAADIRNCSGYTPVAQYGNPGQAVPGERGAVEDVRFVLTQNWKPWLAAGASQSDKLTNGSSGTGNVDVYPVVVVGRDAYGAARLQGYGAVEMFVLNPGQARGADPIGQRGSVGWKAWYGCTITSEPWLVRFECACTANPT